MSFNHGGDFLVTVFPDRLQAAIFGWLVHALGVETEEELSRTGDRILHHVENFHKDIALIEKEFDPHDPHRDGAWAWERLRLAAEGNSGTV